MKKFAYTFVIIASGVLMLFAATQTVQADASTPTGSCHDAMVEQIAAKTDQTVEQVNQQLQGGQRMIDILTTAGFDTVEEQQQAMVEIHQSVQESGCAMGHQGNGRMGQPTTDGQPMIGCNGQMRGMGQQHGRMGMMDQMPQRGRWANQPQP